MVAISEALRTMCLGGGNLNKDVGTSARIANGDINVKSGIPAKRYTRGGLLFADDSELKADVNVLATGYDHDYRNQVSTLVGKEIASQLGDFWGVDSQGDLRGVMKPVYPEGIFVP
ncbi:MAG: hypothetical protein M1831_007555 [Alyxoria varia]|nr:MAG: hypothetical protein M1831_007555 [Alyxoria varia]